MSDNTQVLRDALHFNGLTAQQDELLEVLQEECNEVSLAVSKIQRHGLESNWNGKLPRTNRQDLEREIGHVFNMVYELANHGEISMLEVHRHRLEKAAEIGQFMHHQSGAALDGAEPEPRPRRMAGSPHHSSRVRADDWHYEDQWCKDHGCQPLAAPAPELAKPRRMVRGTHSSNCAIKEGQESRCSVVHAEGGSECGGELRLERHRDRIVCLKCSCWEPLSGVTSDVERPKPAVAEREATEPASAPALTARNIVAKVCNAARNSDLRADDPRILEALDAAILGGSNNGE